MAVDARPDTSWTRNPQLRVGAVVVVAVLVAIGVWLLVHGGGSSGGNSTTGANGPSLGPEAATPQRIQSLAADEGHPIYWVGPKDGTTYELTRTSSGRIFVRYLPSGVPVGTKKAGYTIVGTYPVANATGVLKGLAKQPDEKTLSVPGGGIAVYSSSTPTNVYVAYPGSNLQIEVYDPSAQRAQQLVTSGQVAPVH
jgi:hypothetical protein